MGKEVREHTNKLYKDSGREIPYPNDKVEGEEVIVEEEIKETKSKGKK